MATGGRYVNVPGKGRRYKAGDGKLYQDYRSALRAQGMMENPYTKSGFSQTPSALLGTASSAALSQLGRFGRAINEQVGSAFDPNYIDPASRRFLDTGSLNATPPTNPLAGDSTGRYIPGSMQTRFANTETPTGNTDEYRQQLSQYSPKVFPQTPGGQFERYFQSPEMDQYFGAASRGKGAPGSMEAMTNLASQAKAPLDAPLASYYRAQSAAGRGAMPEVVGGLMQGLEGDKANAMKAWAEANPMLAYREFNKRKTAGDFTPMAPDGVTPMGDLGSRAQEEGGPTMQSFGQGVGNPVVPTQSRNASGMTQGEQMDANRGVTNLQAFQAAKTSGEGMPQFDTTAAPVSQKANDFLQRMGFGVNYQLK